MGLENPDKTLPQDDSRGAFISSRCMSWCYVVSKTPLTYDPSLVLGFFYKGPVCPSAPRESPHPAKTRQPLAAHQLSSSPCACLSLCHHLHVLCLARDIFGPSP